MRKYKLIVNQQEIPVTTAIENSFIVLGRPDFIGAFSPPVWHKISDGLRTEIRSLFILLIRRKAQNLWRLELLISLS